MAPLAVLIISSFVILFVRPRCSFNFVKLDVFGRPRDPTSTVSRQPLLSFTTQSLQEISILYGLTFSCLLH